MEKSAVVRWCYCCGNGCLGRPRNFVKWNWKSQVNGRTGSRTDSMYSHYDNGVDDKSHHRHPKQSAHVESQHNANVDCNLRNDCRDRADKTTGPARQCPTQDTKSERFFRSKQRWKRWIREQGFRFGFSFSNKCGKCNILHVRVHWI